MANTTVGTISWIDLTVENAGDVSDFYSEVIGWEPGAVDMGGYDDYSMNLPTTTTPAAGVCHARGPNADLPPQWLIYITVADLDHSISKCEDLGGEVIAGPRGLGPQGRFCVIRDPAGAVAALFETG